MFVALNNCLLDFFVCQKCFNFRNENIYISFSFSFSQRYKTLDRENNDDKVYKEKFDGSIVVVKIIHQKVQGIAKIPAVKDFINSYKHNHKIFVFDSISDKAKLSLTDLPNTEAFNEEFLMINLVDYIDSPRYEVLTEEETKEMLESYILKKKEMMKIWTTDPAVSYFNLKRGDIIRIIRPSEQSGKSIAYRIVAKGAN